MSKATRKTREAVLTRNPNASDEALVCADEYDEVKEVELLSKSEGGRVLMNRLLDTIASGVDTINTTYKTGTHAELIAVCADLIANVNMYRAMYRSEKKSEELRAILEEALK
jgi:hypothetical protein